jgi:hypothetical protein
MKNKGDGLKTVASLTLSQRNKLFKWCAEHKEDKRTYEEMAKDATAGLGFLVTLNTMQAHWVAENGHRNNSPYIKQDNKLRDIELALAAQGGAIGAARENVRDLEMRLIACEKYIQNLKNQGFQ